MSQFGAFRVTKEVGGGFSANLTENFPSSKTTAYEKFSNDIDLTKLYVSGLAYHTTNESLGSHFSIFGVVKEAVVITHFRTGKSRGFGFVVMGNQLAAERACVDSNPIIEGRRARVNLASQGRKPVGDNKIFTSLSGRHEGYPIMTQSRNGFVSSGLPLYLYQLAKWILALAGIPPTQYAISMAGAHLLYAAAPLRLGSATTATSQYLYATPPLAQPDNDPLSSNHPIQQPERNISGAVTTPAELPAAANDAVTAEDFSQLGEYQKPTVTTAVTAATAAISGIDQCNNNRTIGSIVTCKNYATPAHYSPFPYTTSCFPPRFHPYPSCSIGQVYEDPQTYFSSPASLFHTAAIPFASGLGGDVCYMTPYVHPSCLETTSLTTPHQQL